MTRLSGCSFIAVKALCSMLICTFIPLAGAGPCLSYTGWVWPGMLGAGLCMQQYPWSHSHNCVSVRLFIVKWSKSWHM